MSCSATPNVQSIHHCQLQELRAKADLMERRLTAAERLIGGLASEKERWGADVQVLMASQARLIGDCLLSSSFLSYTGVCQSCQG